MLTPPRVRRSIPPHIPQDEQSVLRLQRKVPATGWFLLVVMVMVEDCKMLQWEKAIFCHSKGTPGNQAFRHHDVNMLS